MTGRTGQARTQGGGQDMYLKFSTKGRPLVFAPSQQILAPPLQKVCFRAYFLCFGLGCFFGVGGRSGRLDFGVMMEVL